MMESKSILLGLIIGVILGGLAMSIMPPSPDTSHLKNQIVQLEAQVSALEERLADLESRRDIALLDVSFSRTEDSSSTLIYWIGRANESIHVCVMLMTQDELADSLIEAYSRGVDVRIVIDDDWYYSSGSDYERIHDVGINIIGDNRAGLMHHKFMIIDEYIVATGSYNWSASAEDSNDENIVILESQPLAGTFLEEFERLWRQS